MTPDDERSAGRDAEAGAPTELPPAGGTTRRGSGGVSGLAFAGLGFQFAVSLVVFYYLGQWLDRRLGTAPVFLLVCVLAGAGAAFYLMYRQMMNAQRREAAARQAAADAARAGSAGPERRP